jgi:hypothetical protein
MNSNDERLTACHHCGGRFGDNETRIVADVIQGDGTPVERIAIHEDCIPDDRLLRYPWENMMVERMKTPGPV